MTKAVDIAQPSTNGAKDDTLDLVMISTERLKELCLIFDHATVKAQFDARLNDAKASGAEAVSRYASFLASNTDERDRADFPKHLESLEGLPPRCWNCGAGPACPCYEDSLERHERGIASATLLIRSLKNTLVELAKIEIKV